MPGWLLVLILVWSLAMSFLSATMYAVDKRRAVVNRSGAKRRRIPERTLHTVDVLGGWPGGLVARRVFHHKRIKAKFVWVSRAIIAIHLALWAMVALLILR